MPSILPTQRGIDPAATTPMSSVAATLDIDPAATTPMSSVAATLDLSAPTVAWLATPHDQALTDPQS